MIDVVLEVSVPLCRVRWLKVLSFMVHALLCADASRTNAGTTATPNPNPGPLVCVGRAQIGAVVANLSGKRGASHVLGRLRTVTSR